MKITDNAVTPHFVDGKWRVPISKYTECNAYLVTKGSMGSGITDFRVNKSIESGTIDFLLLCLPVLL